MSIDAKYNVEFDKLQDLISEGAKNEQNNEGLKEIDDGLYKVDVKEVKIDATKDGRPRLMIVYKANCKLLDDGSTDTAYKGCMWDSTVLCGTKNDGYMIYLANKKLNDVSQFKFSGDWNIDNERLQTDWLPYAQTAWIEVERKTVKGFPQITITNVYDK